MEVSLQTAVKPSLSNTDSSEYGWVVEHVVGTRVKSFITSAAKALYFMDHTRLIYTIRGWRLTEK